MNFKNMTHYCDELENKVERIEAANKQFEKQLEDALENIAEMKEVLEYTKKKERYERRKKWKERKKGIES